MSLFGSTYTCKYISSQMKIIKSNLTRAWLTLLRKLYSKNKTNNFKLKLKYVNVILYMF